MTDILIADEHDVVRQGLRIHLGSEPKWRIVGEAADGKETVLKSVEAKPDVIVLAYELPGINGIEVTSQIRARLPKTEILIYTAYNIESVLGQLLEAGARGFVLKSEPMECLIEGIRKVASRKSYFAGIPSSFEALKKHKGSGTLLTSRERAVVQMIADGHSNKSVANILRISIKTVETHRASVMNKLDLHSSAGLIRYAVLVNVE